MDRGTWKMICQNCNSTFEIVIKPGERVILAAREFPCPYCGTKPDGETVAWHHVIGFHDTRDD
jgi:DNA-directed RNA polymerase subunit RPC12/RpoP